MAKGSIDFREFQWTAKERSVIREVVRSGALTSRRVIAEYGPMLMWSRTVELGYLREVHTIYGAVLGLGPVGRAAFKVSDPQAYAKAPYLTGPNAVLDRAYRNDALLILIEEGYQRHHSEYKMASGMGRVTGAPGFTSQIVSTTMRVPPAEAVRIEWDWNLTVLKPKRTPSGEYPQVAGYPSLYASISGGGIRIERVRALLRRHRLDVTEWRSPLLIVVPDLEPYQDLQRRLARAQAVLRRTDPGPLGRYPDLRLIELPLPRARKSG
jgi:hypothetical protein